CRVVALGTGSKCLGGGQRCAAGRTVSDSHAEAVARRAFQRFLLAELRRLYAGEECCLRRVVAGGGAELRAGVRVHFFASHTPCGDCSIFPRAPDADAGPPAKRARVDGDAPDAHRKGAEPADGDAPDIYRTGAKPVAGERADPRKPGAGYHVTGVLRTKPGRGEPTLSMSCSDKLAKWLLVGVQGALLSCLLPWPVPLSSVVIGRCPYSAAAMRRALVERTALRLAPLIAQSRLEFEFGKAAVMHRAGEESTDRPRREGEDANRGVEEEGSASRVVPSPCSVAWSLGCSRELEVFADGVRQGVTKKARGTAAARVAICRRDMMQEFVQLLKDVGPEQLPTEMRLSVDGVERLSYKQMKGLAKCYGERWRRVKEDIFPNWVEKPVHLTDFTLADS
ncbi:tRNA-specific adenosine deaminase 1-like, partial [Pollicipes pollicipes]|uniref:tRNA-specific adenosine deaminase 1-like n=1 Tax=Pollicipes pollicipes TaxID=41117 RepID=UPI0018858A4E